MVAGVAHIGDVDVRIIHTVTGEIIRTLRIYASRYYHGNGPPEAAHRTPKNRTTEL